MSTPGLAFEAMLKCTKVKLELLTGIDMVLMVKKSIRDGLTQVVKKHAVANHKYLPNYDASKNSVFLQYLDANNLYGYAMGQKLPLDGYEWDDIKKFSSDFVKNCDVNDDKGYLLEVDVEYPEEMRDAHGELPFLAEYGKIADVNKKVIDNMKDEIGKGYMTEFAALSPKVYAFKESRPDNSLIEHKKAKGANKMVTKKQLCFDMYK